MPGNTRASRYRMELMNDIPRNKVDVVIEQLKSGVADALTPQQI